MQIALVGPGRAGLSLAIAVRRSGHDLVGVLGRTPEATQAAGGRLQCPPIGEQWPDTEITIVAVRDGAIATVAGALAARPDLSGGFVHLSGLTPVDALRALAERGLATASFHPLQTLPEPEVGADRLPGSWVGITSEDNLLADRLFALAVSIETRPFELNDDDKAIYHAGAAAAANYPLAALSTAVRCFAAAGVPWEAARPLVEAVMSNAFELGPDQSLTGPIARADRATIEAQLSAVGLLVPERLEDFRAMARATARVAGTLDVLEDVL